MGFISFTVAKDTLVGNVLWNLFPRKTWKSKLSEKIILTTVEPRLSGLFDYPDFFSGPVFFMNINKL